MECSPHRAGHDLWSRRKADTACPEAGSGHTAVKLTLQELAFETSTSFHIGIGSVFKYNLIERMLRSYLEYLTETGRIELIVKDSVLRYSRCL